MLGHNGSGKSTLAKLMNAIFLPSSGRVFVDGIDTADEERLLDIRRTVGMVFQNPDNQIVANVVEDDVAFAPENLGVPSAEIRERLTTRSGPWACTSTGCTRRTCSRAGRSSASPSRACWQCSRAASCSTSRRPMLDPVGRREVVATVTRLCREKGMTVVLITHHMSECVGADRLIVMSEGRIAADGTPREVFSQGGAAPEGGALRARDDGAHL